MSDILNLTVDAPIAPPQPGASYEDQLEAKLTHVQRLLETELTVGRTASLTCSFQAEDVLLLHLVLKLRPQIPVLFLETGYHFAETLHYRDQITRDWNLQLTNLTPVRTIEEQEAEHGPLYATEPDQCCKLRKVVPLFNAVGNYDIWLTGLRREQARSRAVLEEVADFALPSGITVRKLSPFADWSTRDVWTLCDRFTIPLLPLYAQGYTSIGCAPCTTLPTDPNDPRSGRWAGKKVECGIHIAAPTPSAQHELVPIDVQTEAQT